MWQARLEPSWLRRRSRVLTASIVGGVLVGALSSAHAALAFVSVVPSTWRLQTYAGATGSGNVVLWFTGSPCTNGSLVMNNASEQDKNRLWATVMAAKLANRHMFVYYDDTNCVINSFGFDDQ